MSEFFSRAKLRVTSTASSSNAHGTRWELEPCRRECEDSRPKLTQRLNSPAEGVPSKPPMSWLQKPKPPRPSDSPPRSDSAMAVYVDSQSPPQCTGNRWPPTVADRAYSTASPVPRTLSIASKTVRL